MLERSNEGVSISGKEEESENGASQRGGKAQTSRRPTRKVTGFETTSASHENGEMATSVRKTEADMSTLSIGFFRKRKVRERKAGFRLDWIGLDLEPFVFC